MKGTKLAARWLVVLVAGAVLALPLPALAPGRDHTMLAAAASLADAPTPSALTPPSRGDDGDSSDSASPAPSLQPEATATSEGVPFDSPLDPAAVLTATASAFDSPLVTPTALGPGATAVATPTLSGTVIFVSPIDTPTTRATASPTATATAPPSATAGPLLTATPTVSLYPTPAPSTGVSIRSWEYLATGVIVLALAVLFGKALIRALR